MEFNFDVAGEVIDFDFEAFGVDISPDVSFDTDVDVDVDVDVE